METRFDISDKSETEIHEIARDILNNAFGYQFEYRRERGMYSDLLFNVNKNRRAEAFAEVIWENNITAKSAQKLIQEQIRLISMHECSFYILLSFKKIDKAAIDILDSYLKKITKNDFRFSILDINWIHDQLLSHPEIADKHFPLKETSYFSIDDLNTEHNSISTDEYGVGEMEIGKENNIIDVEYYSKKYSTILQSEEFYFQKAINTLNELKMISAFNPEVFLSIFRESEKEANEVIYSEFKNIWENRGQVNMQEFINTLNNENQRAYDLFKRINRFLSYVDAKSWNRSNLNEYSDKRSIANTGVFYHYLVDQFIEFALNDFIYNENNNKALIKIIQYLEFPIQRFNIISENHKSSISKFFLGKSYVAEEFHQKLKHYFDQFNFPITNPKNATCLYTCIIYDEEIRKLWDSTENKKSRIDEIIEKGIPEDIKYENFFSEEDDTDNTEKIPFQLDRVVKEDKLGREPVAKAFADLLKKDIFTEELDHSFIVHLQGEWGTGKSSFLNFIKKHLNSENERWIIVEYNAWQNQHLTPPWWIMINQIYHQSKNQLSWCNRIVLEAKENIRRIIWYSGWQKILALVLTIGFIILLVIFSQSIIDFISNSPLASENVNNVAKGLTLSVFAKLFLTISSGVGVIYSFSKFLSTPFFLKSTQEAESFERCASDPMNRVKEHFGRLVENINQKSRKKWCSKKKVPARQLAVIIDDIDRCNKEFIVELLEGIQTLFKEKRVLYIVAGDKQWITTSFGESYKEFSDGEDYNRLGESFLEKVFQLSFRMPKVEDESKKKFWSHILGLPEDVVKQQENVDSIEKLDPKQKEQVRARLKTATVDIATPEFMNSVETDFNLSADTVSNIVIEEKNKDKEDIQHLLKDYHSIIDPNPRSIIRLANNYSMTRNTLIAERKNISADKIFRWLVIEDLLPSLKHISEIEEIHKYLENDIPKKKVTVCNSILAGNTNYNETAIDIEDIKNIKGI